MLKNVSQIDEKYFNVLKCNTNSNNNKQSNLIIPMVANHKFNVNFYNQYLLIFKYQIINYLIFLNQKNQTKSNDNDNNNNYYNCHNQCFIKYPYFIEINVNHVISVNLNQISNFCNVKSKKYDTVLFYNPNLKLRFNDSINMCTNTNFNQKNQTTNFIDIMGQIRAKSQILHTNEMKQQKQHIQTNMKIPYFYIEITTIDQTTYFPRFTFLFFLFFLILFVLIAKSCVFVCLLCLF